MVSTKLPVKQSAGVRLLQQDGFTLIEIVLLISILGVAAALAIPKLGTSIARYELDNTARQLMADLRWMQQLSINTGEGVIPRMTFSSSAPYSYSVTVSARSRKTVKLPASVSVVNSYISFNTGGLPEEPERFGTTVTLHSTKISGLNRKIIIDSRGRVRME
ncbi:Tfp pilus assembly protein FimT/FimU [Sporomusa aerivorans]|uniref:Tfp pilus assembly protein FimT/FimU n=1 Tax=Sporomusa aerivorans TaxID=204936 RepID=UPI003529FB04